MSQKDSAKDKIRANIKYGLEHTGLLPSAQWLWYKLLLLTIPEYRHRKKKIPNQILQIQIQTVDSCNSFCLMCPYKDIPHTNKIMTTDLFSKIINEINEHIKGRKIREDVVIKMFFQNEPLLDPLLFDRTSYVKKTIPSASIVLFTNGLLIPKLKNKIIKSEFDYIQFACYGYDAQSYNDITQLRITDEHYRRMMNAAE
ncbi:hypothetical protein ACFLRM_06765, partial [Acidobacteriota bacterium]